MESRWCLRLGQQPDISNDLRIILLTRFRKTTPSEYGKPIGGAIEIRIAWSEVALKITK